VYDLGVREIAQPPGGVRRQQGARAHLIEHIEQLLPIHVSFVPC
jgi:hypothetical protein